MLRWHKILRDEVGEGDGGGGTSGYADPATPPAGDAPQETPPAAQSAKPADAEASGDNVDEFGYEKTPEAEAAEKKEAGKKAGAEKVDEVKDPATGYSDVEDAEEGEEDPPAPPKEEEIKLDYELKTEGLEANDAKKVKEFAKANGLTQEVAQKFADLFKTERESLKQSMIEKKQAAEKQVAEQKKAWAKELKTDPTFGGEKFAHNVQRAEKFLSEYMPETKKVLTERKSMLPPYVMRDMMKLADRMYSSERLVHGEINTSKEQVQEEDDHLSFYT